MSAPMSAVPDGVVNDPAVENCRWSQKTLGRKTSLRRNYLTSSRYELSTTSSTNERPVLECISKNKQVLTKYFKSKDRAAFSWNKEKVESKSRVVWQHLREIG